jgi:hypothetical protein
VNLTELSAKRAIFVVISCLESAWGLILPADHRSDACGVADACGVTDACQRIMSVFVMVLPKPMAKY